MRGSRLVRTRLAAVAAAAATVVAVAALAPVRPAAAEDPIAAARAELDQARAEALEAAARYDSTVAERQQTEAQIAALAEMIPKLRAREAELRVIISDRAAALYRNSDSGTTFQISGKGDPTDGARRTELTEAATDYDVDTARQLSETSEQLGRAEVEMRFRKAQLDELVVRLEREQLDFEAKVATAEKALWRAEIVGAMRARGTTTIVGPSALAPEEIAGWFRATGGRSTVAGISIEELAAIYVEEGAAAGVRGDIAFAQSIVETGSFNVIGPNNFAGLGACDSCADMTHFPTPRDGVRAQVQHLRNYADPNSRSDGLGHPPSPYWYGEGDFDTFFAKGWCSTWEEMGAGNWATDPGYAPKVLAVYDRMLEYGT
jgi:hypothetical protein